MTTKQARLDVRLDPEAKEHIERAARLSHESVSGFVVHAAAEAADRVLARADVTVMPASQFDVLLAALDIPDEAPTLAQLNKRHRGYARK